MSLFLAGDLPYIMVVGQRTQFLSLTKDYAVPECLAEGTNIHNALRKKKGFGTDNDGTPALFLGK